MGGAEVPHDGGVRPKPQSMTPQQRLEQDLKPLNPLYVGMTIAHEDDVTAYGCAVVAGLHHRILSGKPHSIYGVARQMFLSYKCAPMSPAKRQPAMMLLALSGDVQKTTSTGRA